MKPTRKCAIDGCDQKVYARGWCSKHYARWHRHGDPQYTKFKRNERPENGLCSIHGCNNPYYYSGVCSAHYTRRMRHGDHMKTVPIQERFHDPEAGFKARTEASGDCVEWVGWRTPQGYGRFKMNGKHMPAHRYAWERVNGPIPEGLQIDHICHNRACVKISHLRLATGTENVRNLAGAPKDNKHSGIRNVSKMGDRWRVRVTKNGVVHYLGVYQSKDEAARVAADARERLFGEFAGLG